MLKCEQETVINFDAETDRATVYTAYPPQIRHMDKLMAEHPESVKLLNEAKKDNVLIARTYEVPKEYITIRPKRRMSDEQREYLRQRAFKMGWGTAKKDKDNE